jgi:membrane protein
VGFLILLISAGVLLKNLDASLNEIWNVRRKRPWHVRATAYALVLTAGPLFTAISLAGTAGIRKVLAGTQIVHFEQISGYATLAAVVCAFTLLYYVVPNAQVRLRSALAGGLVAGSAWEVAKYLYALFGSKAFQLNPVYGSLGAAPLFLAWLYVSWILLLFGARLAYAVEQASNDNTIRQLGDHPRGRELIGTRLAQLVTLAQMHGTPAPTPREVAKKLQVSEEKVRDVAERMEQAGLLATVLRGGLVAARMPDSLTVAEISRAVGGAVVPQVEADAPDEFQDVQAVFADVDEASETMLGAVTWSELVGASEPRGAGEPPTQRVRAGRRNP